MGGKVALEKSRPITKIYIISPFDGTRYISIKEALLTNL